MRKIPAMFAAGAVALLAGCGDSDESSEVQSTTTTASGAAVTTTVAPSGGATSTTAASGSATTTAPAGSVPVTLADRTLQSSNTLKAGSVTFAVTNSSRDNQHELAVFKGKFADLPKTANGAVDESKLAAGTLVGRTNRLAGGSSASVTVTLAAGPYALVCNITNGPTSHAAQGQVLDVAVS
jgi:uncharacterized cupredoxin-like copper-binding protein